MLEVVKEEYLLFFIIKINNIMMIYIQRETTQQLNHISTKHLNCILFILYINLLENFTN